MLGDDENFQVNDIDGLFFPISFYHLTRYKKNVKMIAIRQ